MATIGAMGRGEDKGNIYSLHIHDKRIIDSKGNGKLSNVKSSLSMFGQSEQ